jgi:hypothetical protein
LLGGNGAQGLIIITYTVRRGRSRAYVIS